jgi:hypothetical protein
MDSKWDPAALMAAVDYGFENNLPGITIKPIRRLIHQAEFG